jgi:hypothetical protein
MEQDFVLGVNYPWKHYGQDFGTCGWGYRGLAAAPDELERDFSHIRRVFGPGSVVRIFVFADGRSSPEFDPKGEVIGFDQFFFADFDQLLKTASVCQLRLMPVLLDFHWFHRSGIVGGVPLAGHSEIVEDPDKRQSFLSQALEPILVQYGTAREIFCWDLINEPEWVVRWLSLRLPRRGAVSIQSMRGFLLDCSTLIHRLSDQRVTVGSARPQWLHYWTELGLDLYQCHWYTGRIRLRWAGYRAGIHQLGKPCLVGEVPTRNTRLKPAEAIRRAREEGYAGLLFWSYRAKDHASGFPALEQALGVSSQ